MFIIISVMFRNLCGNQLASRVIELLLPSASYSVLLSFCSALGTDLRLVCSDSFASHVLEKLLILTCFGRLEAAEGGESITAATDPEVTAWVKKVCRFLTNNFADFCTDTYASHLLRTCCQCLSGSRIPPPSSANRSPRQPGFSLAADKQTEGYAAMNQFNYGSDEELESILELFADKIQSSLDVELASDELASSVVQVFLQVAAAGGHRKPVKAVLKFLLDKIFSTVDYLEEPGLVRLLEVVVAVCPTYEKLSAKLYKKVFEGRLAAMAVHQGGNYLVQRLLDSLTEGDQLETVWGELAGSSEEIMTAGYTGNTAVRLVI